MDHSQSPTGVQDAIDQFSQRYSAMDADGVVALFADDSLVVGTGADEVRFGLSEIRSQVERDISQADEISLKVENPRVTVVGDAAFGYADVAFVGSAGGEAFELPARWTFGLLHAEDGWRFMQCHVSVAFGAQAEGESFPT